MYGFPYTADILHSDISCVCAAEVAIVLQSTCSISSRGRLMLMQLQIN